MEEYIKGTKGYIKGTYEELLLYYYKRGIGKESEITGVIITDSLVNTIEKRYKQLGGNPSRLRIIGYMPSMNGSIGNEN